LLTSALPGAQRFAVPADAFGADADAGAVVLALWRPSPALCERVDELAFSSQRPWLPVIAEHPVIRVGPWIAPPAAPCYACYQARRGQHDEQRETTGLLHDAYDRDESCGPAGFLPHHARTAAGIALSMLEAAARGTLVTGQVVTARLTRLEVSADRVVPMHGCARCSSPGAAAERDLRAVFRLRQGVPAL
jgi:bacteriocin biosynthesis cyclodehydratase domain-containing protein